MMRQINILFALGVALFSNAVFAVPPIEHWTTSNGARVMFISAPALPMIDIRVTWQGGSARDAEQPGISRLTNRLLDEGAGDWDAYQISERFDETGARFESGTLRDMAWVSLRSLTDEKLFEKSFETFKAVVAKPRFGAEAIERIRESMLTSLKAIEESPSSVGNKRYYELLYGNHPYASSPKGTAEFLKSATRDEILAFYQTYYVAKNAVIAIVGDLDSSAAHELSESLMSEVAAGNRAKPLPDVAKLDAEVVEHLAFPSTQTHLFMGHPSVSRGDPDYYVLYVGNYILGGSGLVSRLSEEVREKRGLSYSVHSYFVPMAKPGPFQLKLQTKNSQVDEALKVVRETVQKFLDEGPTDAELDAAIKGITGGFPLRIDNNSKLVEYLALIAFYDLPLDYLDTFPTHIKSVTAAQIRDAFKRRVALDKMVVLTVGGED